MTIQKILAKYVVDLKYTDVSDASVEKIKYLLLDAVGIGYYSSSQTAWGKILNEYAVAQNHPGKAAVIGSDATMHPSTAAFTNGAHMLGCEMEDTLTHAYLHLGPAVFATSMALSEHYSLKGKDVITAVYGAYEITAPLGEIYGKRMLLKGAHPTSHLACIAAAATASKLLGLTVEQTENALGIAIMMSSGFMQSINEGSMTRRLYGGLPAQTGIAAAELAQRGFDGPHHSLEGEGGLFRTLFPEKDVDLKGVKAKLGKSHQVLKSSFKRHACCHAFHACIDILLDLQKQSNFELDQIEKIEGNIKLISYSHANKRPVNAASAQYSLPYCLATALREGRVGPPEFTQAAIDSTDWHQLADLVETNFPDDLQETTGFPGRLTVVLKDGTSLSGSLPHGKADVQNEQTYQLVEDKFADMTRDVLSDAGRQHIRAQCESLDTLEDLSVLLSPQVTSA